MPAGEHRQRRRAPKQTAWVRDENMRLLINGLRQLGVGQSVGRDELADEAGVALGTANRALKAVRDLDDTNGTSIQDRVLQIAPIAPDATPRTVRLNPQAGHAAAVEFSHAHITVVVSDLSASIAHRSQWQMDDFDVDRHPQGAINRSVRMLRELVDRNGIQPEDMVGVGVAVAAPVDNNGTVQALGGGGSVRRLGASWVGMQPAAYLREQLGESFGEIEVGNDANFAALEEFEWQRRARPDLSDHLHIKWATGLGCGVIINGELHEGRAGLAGELGHDQVINLADEDRLGIVCDRCGKTDCLEVVVSYAALKKRLGHQKRREVDADPLARPMFERFAGYIGGCLGPVVAILNPQLITVSGPSARLDFIAPTIRDAITSMTAPRSAGAVQVAMSERRWTEIEDESGRLAVGAGAINRVLETHLAAYVMARVSPQELEAPELALA